MTDERLAFDGCEEAEREEMVSSSSGSEAKKRDNENWNVPFVETTKLERRRVIGRRRVVGKSMGFGLKVGKGKRDG